jgi:hypothetical protein
MYKLIPATPEHWDRLVADMRQEVKDEVYFSHVLRPEAIQKNVSPMSSDIFALYDGDVLLGITGIHRISFLSDGASPWFLSTNKVKYHPKALILATKELLRKWTTEHDLLINYIPATFTDALRWVKWAGYEVYDAAPYGPFGVPFHRIEIRSAEWVG